MYSQACCDAGFRFVFDYFDFVDACLYDYRIRPSVGCRRFTYDVAVALAAAHSRCSVVGHGLGEVWCGIVVVVIGAALDRFVMAAACHPAALSFSCRRSSLRLLLC